MTYKVVKISGMHMLKGKMEELSKLNNVTYISKNETISGWYDVLLKLEPKAKLGSINN